MFWTMLMWAVLEPFFAPASAVQFVESAGADCAYGCIVEESGKVYELTREDLTYLALLAKAESGPRFVRDESAATLWAMVQRWWQVNERRSSGDRISLAASIRSYSAVLGDRWRTGGSKGYHPRITPRADEYADLGWDDLPTIWRFFAIEFVEGLVENRWPGIVHVLARGFEDAADDHLIGPYYATTSEQHPGGNAYYKVAETEWWAPWKLRVVPATAKLGHLVSRRLPREPE